MNWKELKHEINRGMVRFFRESGNQPDIIFLGKKEYDVLVNHFGTEDRWEEDKEVVLNDNRMTLWNMDVHLDALKESDIRFESKHQDLFDLANENTFETYRMKIDVSIPLVFRSYFASFLGKQSDHIGVHFVRFREEVSRRSNDINFQIHVSGVGKEIVEAWVNYILKIVELLNSKEKENAEKKK